MKMKNKIIEICELGQPQSIIHRENEPITELIKTDSLIEELNKQLTLTDVVASLKDKQAIAFEEYTKSEGYTEISYELYKKGNMYCNRNRLFRQYKKKHNL